MESERVRQLAVQVLEENRQGTVDPVRRIFWIAALQGCPQQLLANLPVEKPVVELVAEAPQTAIAGGIAAFRTLAEYLQREIEQCSSPRRELR